ncbi:MAG: HEAT repeat domain-containing protein [Gemmatimonadaceae bacterium]|nr:HEAT repeat domain-containing protein [Gemmatimonadaceae bacterium]
MHQSLLFAKSLALLLEEVQTSADLTMVRSGLLRVRRFSRSHSLTVQLQEGRMVVDGHKLQRPVPQLQRLMLAMTMHGVARISITAGAVPRELLKLAMLLARKPVKGGDTPTIFEELRVAALWDVQVYPAARQSDTDQAAAYADDIGLDAPLAIAERVREYRVQVQDALDARDSPALATALSAIAIIEASVTVRELRDPWTVAFDDLATSDVLRALVAALPTSGQTFELALAVLRRAGEPGAAILIEHLLTAESMDVRRACFDATIEVRRGTDHLLKMLDHEQWFVVRNAALLLGAMTSRSSEPELTATLTHADERVRAAVVTALLQLDTATSRATVRGALRDASPEVRRRAVRGFLAEAGNWTNVEKLLQALERETELDVQLEFLYALGTLATPDAVQKLIRLCSADGRYRPPDFRIAAAEALATARLGASVPLLRAMLKDPDMHARAAARHLIRAVS